MPADSFKTVKDLLDEEVKAKDAEDAAEEQAAPRISKREKEFNRAFRAASGPFAKSNWRAGG